MTVRLESKSGGILMNGNWLTSVDFHLNTEYYIFTSTERDRQQWVSLLKDFFANTNTFELEYGKEVKDHITYLLSLDAVGSALGYPAPFARVMKKLIGFEFPEDYTK